MLRKKKGLDESELEDTKVVEGTTPEKEEVEPGAIENPESETCEEAPPEPEAEEKEEVVPEGFEVPKEEGAKETEDRDDVCVKEAPEHKVVKEDPSVFTERVLLGVELIKSKSLQEIIEILDYQLQAIRNLAIEKITEYKD